MDDVTEKVNVGFPYWLLCEKVMAKEADATRVVKLWILSLQELREFRDQFSHSSSNFSQSRKTTKVLTCRKLGSVAGRSSSSSLTLDI